MNSGPFHIVPFRQDLAPAFAALNLAWIEQYFRVEAADRLALSDCESAIVMPGGQIFFALSDEVAIGTCAVIRLDRTTCELAKMAVTPAAQGRGVGRRLGETAIEFARRTGARKIVLLTNSRLTPALRLYEQLGFTRGPLPAHTQYARADVYMELALA
jgi:GNAT superfamily N-acetyltransferase